ncbi:GrpB family protein [Sporolactobacillus sp. CPB3-1]|uniref:GrpB family protein n=1 Tax=Sporolactobacillus mangiferae TaxID=2940498 RepID=A0ABT0MA88_9BACL|nr:GrpB family protein [Sporolactobacillus mangiferae]MCL1631791.1 GrpB family protein [Sporolactobacillus mangiferae]
MSEKEIQVVPYNANWSVEYKKEAARIVPLLKPILRAIHHIGSTSIPNMAAKPTIDILAEVTTIEMCDSFTNEFVKIDYQPFGEYGIKNRRYFVKKDRFGNHLVHLHAFETESEQVIRHLAFRDYLKTHEETARFYCQLKLQLAKEFPNDREGYCIGKDEACKRIEQLALHWWYEG